MLAAKSLYRMRGLQLVYNVIRSASIPQTLSFKQIARLSTSQSFSKNAITNTQSKFANEEENFKCRVDLAAAYQVMAYLGLEEGIDNHLTLRAPCAHNDSDVMLINPYGLHWSQVTASSLIGVDFETGSTVEGKGDVMPTAFCIHRAIHRARSGDGSNCVMHTHQPYTTALACLKDPRLLMLHQNSARFHGKIAYDQEFDGVADMEDNIDEGDRMARAFKDKDVMLMGNHGVSAVGPTVAYVFNSLYFLERACEVQIKAMSTGRELSELPLDIVEKTAEGWTKFDYLIPLFLNSMKEVLLEKGSKFNT